MTVLNLNGKNTYFADPYWNNVILFLENNLTDQSGKSLSVGQYGGYVNTDPIENALYFDGSSYLQIPNNYLDYGATEDFTVDFWVKSTKFNLSGIYQLIYRYLDGTYKYVDETGNNNRMHEFNFELTFSNSVIEAYLWDSNFFSNTQWIMSQDYINADSLAWHHIALTRKYNTNGGNYIYFFVDGNRVNMYYYSDPSDLDNSVYAKEFPPEGEYSTPPNEAIVLGRSKRGVSEWFFEGYLKYFRFTKGVARFTENFDPQSLFDLQPLTALYYGNTLVEKLYKGDVQLYPQIPTDPYLNDVVLYLKGDDFTDSSPNPKTVNTLANSVLSADSKYGSNSFNFSATNSAIYINSNAGLTTLNNVTIEFWCKKTVTAFINYYLEFNGLTAASIEDSKRIQHRDSGSHRVFSPDTNNTISITNNVWTHLAFVCTTGQVAIYKNGTLVENLARTLPSLNSNPLYIGTGYNADNVYKGLIDSFRITKAVRYTADFNPETDTYLAY